MQWDKGSELSNFALKQDIICFAESKLNSTDFLPDIKDFKKIRKDRSNCIKDGGVGGGLVAFVPKEIHYESISCNKAPKNFEYILLKIS